SSDLDEHADCRLEGSPAREAALEILAGIDREACEAALADKRYEVIAAILAQVCRLAPEKISASDRIDRVVTNRYLGIPIFLALMWGAFELTFAVGGFFGEAIEAGFGVLGEAAATIEPGWLASLIGDGILGGVGAVLAFVPHIFILFLILSIMEASGYLARAAFIMDRLMYAFGLPGKAFIPMLMGFGCNVPAIMATRTIEDHKERLITIMVNPFISCGARLPIYVLFTGIFFGREAGTVIFALYVLGIAVAIGSAKLFRSTILPGESAAFIMELPPYRLPTLRGSMIQMWDRGSTYLKKAGGIILIGAVIIWALASNPPGVEYGSQESLVGIIGNMLSPAVEPLGLNGKIAVALIFGILAKEIVVSSLGVLYGAGEDAGSLTDALAADPGLGPASALALMVFALLYLPCIATLAVIRAETGSWRWTGFAVGYGVVIAWLLAFFAYQAGRLIWGI
ncbi:MAG: ferrous iron transport protein B, partial [Methanomicrobiaceae archaeon]|nr:ferrous iron transport protein B [Methanomicrobiaceae archaeon]